MHALLLEGTYEWAVTRLPEECRTENIDVLHYYGERMGIDEVRALIAEAYKTPLVRNDRVFVLAYTLYTEDAQNALLKLLEEPPRTARFYVVTNRPDILLPTLRSRLVGGDVETYHSSYDHRDFLHLTHNERLTRIAEHAKEKDEAWFLSLIEFFESEAEQRKDPTLIRSLLELKPYFHMPGASRKMILEHLALLFPSHTTVV
jgi:hypothetical protein